MSFPGRRNPPRGANNAPRGGGNNNNAGGGGGSSNTPPTSEFNRHGRIRSNTTDPATLPQGPLRPFPQGPTSPRQGHAPIPTVAGRDPRDPPTVVQTFAEGSVSPFLRWAFTVFENNRARPNFDFLPDVDIAIRVSETIVSNPSCSLPFH